jgi:hypothetical protein
MFTFLERPFSKRSGPFMRAGFSELISLGKQLARRTLTVFQAFVAAVTVV